MMNVSMVCVQRRVGALPGNQTTVVNVALTRRTTGRNVFFGGGSLVTTKHVLSCAHCWNRESLSNVSIWLGVYRMSYSTFFQYKTMARSVEIHPDFDVTTLANDIAVVRLKDEVPLWRLGGYVNTICLPPPGFKAQESAYVTGWGYLSENGPVSDVLQVVKLPLVSLDACKMLNRFRVTDTNICAGYMQGGKDACTGDSGGPMFQIIDNRAVQIAIVSWGRSCAVPNSPGVYTDVVPYLRWIHGILSADGKNNVKLSQFTTDTNGTRRRVTYVAVRQRRIRLIPVRRPLRGRAAS
ncbi:trypsin I-P1-like [Ornithodoros turicata]|uniref:trypsin I-P1-like n=1 Tax=Ornithodoros turicata TaxID=34597 RepID=UPI00313969A5